MPIVGRIDFQSDDVPSMDRILAWTSLASSQYALLPGFDLFGFLAMAIGAPSSGASAIATERCMAVLNTRSPKCLRARSATASPRLLLVCTMVRAIPNSLRLGLLVYYNI